MLKRQYEARSYEDANIAQFDDLLKDVHEGDNGEVDRIIDDLIDPEVYSIEFIAKMRSRGIWHDLSDKTAINIVSILRGRYLPSKAGRRERHSKATRRSVREHSYVYQIVENSEHANFWFQCFLDLRKSDPTSLSNNYAQVSELFYEKYGDAYSLDAPFSEYTSGRILKQLRILNPEINIQVVTHGPLSVYTGWVVDQCILANSENYDVIVAALQNPTIDFDSVLQTILQIAIDHEIPAREDIKLFREATRREVITALRGKYLPEEDRKRYTTERRAFTASNRVRSPEEIQKQRSRGVYAEYWQQALILARQPEYIHTSGPHRR